MPRNLPDPSNPDFLLKEIGGLDMAYKRKERKEQMDNAPVRIGNGWSLDEAFALESILNELNRRQSEALALFRPVPGMVDLPKCKAGEIGVVGPNRSGKTLSIGERIARIATGRHPIPDMFPVTNGDGAIVGPTLKHCRLLYHTLFKPGQFRILKTATGWKVPDFNTPEDVKRIREWQPAPPLIPKRLVQSIAWEDAKEDIPAMITLTNGWILHFFSYESDPPRGVAWNFAWLDEEHPRLRYWLSETRARLMSVKGYLIISATEESATPTMHRLQSRAKRPDMASKPDYKQTRFFKIFAKDNPYLDPEAREAFSERLREDDPDAAAAKIDGESAFAKYLVYREFDEMTHVIDPFPITWEDTVYVVVDPSRTRLAMLLLAILHPGSPNYEPKQPDRIVAFDEIVLRGAKSSDAADALAHKLNNVHKHWVESIIIDWQQGRKRDDSDTQIAEYYWRDFQERGIKPRVDSFIPGSSNLEGGIETVAQFLSPKDGLPPKFVCMRGTTQELVWEFLRYYRIKNPDGSAGKPFQRNNDLVDCARYACQADLVWVQPPGMRLGEQHLTGDELKAIDRNPRLWFYRATMGKTQKQRT